ncbi:MAG: hypothetical protein U0531_01800 [Dehalococcoidia bacterium]
MIGPLGGLASHMDYNPTNTAELAEAGVKARLQIAALKTEQDVMRTQAEALLSLFEPTKGVNIDTRA